MKSSKVAPEDGRPPAPSLAGSLPPLLRLERSSQSHAEIAQIVKDEAQTLLNQNEGEADKQQVPKDASAQASSEPRTSGDAKETRSSNLSSSNSDDDNWNGIESSRGGRFWFRRSKGVDRFSTGSRNRMMSDSDTLLDSVPEIHLDRKIKGSLTFEPEDDTRTTQEKLTDYLLTLANPSQQQRRKDPLLTVFEEGEGGRYGVRAGYWKHKYTKERRLRKAELHKLIDDPTIELARIRSENRRDHDGALSYSANVWRNPDNEVFCCHNPNLREFYELGGYRYFPDVVGVELLVRELTMINASTSSFHVGFTIGLRWYDPVFDTAQFWNRMNATVFARSIPYVTLNGHDRSNPENIGVPLDADDPNLSDLDRHCGMVVVRKDGLDPPGVLYHKISVEATFKKAMYLGWFPFDKQKLMMHLELAGAGNRADDDFGRVLLPINVDMSLDTPHDEWYVFVANAISTKRRNYPQELQVQINVRRRPAYFIINVISVIFLLTTLSFSAFELDNQWEWYGDRCQITLTLMLTSIAYKFFLADQIPNVAYLTVLDWYIYLGIFTTSMILLMNTVALCQNDCELENEIEDASILAISILWGTGNLLMIILIFWYVFEIVWRDSHLRQYAKDGEDKYILQQSNRDEAEIQARREKERFYPPEANTLAKRRAAALNRFDLIQIQQEILHEQKANGEDVDDLLMPNVPLKNKIIRSRSFTAADTRNLPETQLASVAELCGADLADLFRRAGMSEHVATLAPLLTIAELTTPRLLSLYNNGIGTQATLSILEEAGVRELPDRVRLIDALKKAVADSKPEPVEPYCLLVLQGSASYLWKEANQGCQVPILHEEFMSKVNERKIQIISEMAMQNYNEMSEEWADKNKKLTKSLANCLIADIALKSIAGSAAKFVFASRTLDGVTNIKLYTQVWVGYCLKKYEEGVLPPNNHAILMDIGSGKIALGYAKPRSAREPVEASVLEDNEKLINSSELTNTLFDAVQGHDGNDASATSDTEMLRAICDMAMDLLRKVFQSAAEHNDYLFSKANPDGEPHKLSIFLFGTSKLRQWQSGLQAQYGARPLELMEAIAVFCTEKLNNGENRLHENVEVSVVFEIISASYEAQCEKEAFRHALEFKSDFTGWPQELLQSLRPKGRHVLRGDDERPFSKISNLAWGGGSLQGNIADNICSMEMGVSSVEQEIDGSLKKVRRSMESSAPSEITEVYDMVKSKIEKSFSDENHLFSPSSIVRGQVGLK